MWEKLTKYQASVIIKDAEIRLADFMKKATELEPQVKEYKQAYESLLKDFESTKEKIEEEKNLLEMASRDLNSIGKNREFRVLRSESHSEMKPREQKKLHDDAREKKPVRRWTEEACIILLRQNKMMKIDDLFEILAEKFEITQKEKSHVKWGIVNNCWLANTKYTRADNPRGKLFEHKGYLGLKEWMSPDYKPAGIYAKIG
jgi:hypothetical protein